MTLSTDQLKHDRINLGRLVRRLENVISDENWSKVDHPKGEQAWAKAQGMAQKIKYARQLLLNVNYHQEMDSPISATTSSQQRNLQNMRETLDRLDGVVDVLIQRLAPEPVAPSSYLSLVPIPAEVSNLDYQGMESSTADDLIPSAIHASQRYTSCGSPRPDAAQGLLPSPPELTPSDPVRAARFSQPHGTSSLLSASLQTHEELSNELSRMATQLKRNAQHFSESLDKDKSLIHSASEVLEKNYDTMTKERVRLRDHTGRSSSTTWMIFGALVAVSMAWVFMFFVIRIT